MLAECLELVRGVAKSRDALFFRAETVHALVSYRVRAGSHLAPRYFEQSHGESALEMVRAASARGGLWIFDEPESGLSFSGQLQLMSLLLEHIESGHQVILCTHSPLLMQIPGARVLEIGEWGIRETSPMNLRYSPTGRRFWTRRAGTCGTFE